MKSADANSKQDVSRGSLWRKVIGWTCLSIGFLGVVLPIIPGIPFLLVGLGTLSTEHHWVRALLLRLKRKAGKFVPLKFHVPRRARKATRNLIQSAHTDT